MGIGSRESRAGSVADLAPPKADPPHARERASGCLLRWWALGGAPVLLRLPRGFAVVLVVAAVGLVVLAYRVGFSRGEAAAELRLIELADSGRPLLRQPPPLPQGSTPPPAEQAPRAPAGLLQGDLRQVGLNYLILARYPKDEAQRLREFLASRGVETIAVPSDNARLFHVVAWPGFTGDQWSGPNGTAFVAEMRKHGAAWKLHNNNRGDDLRSMYWKLYEGK
jgi:hypothetical protein